MTFPAPDAFAIDVLLAAAGVAVVHTVIGADHYLPFIMLARARGWTRARTLLVTVACGAGHVASSILLGLLGLAAGAAIGRIEAIEGARGDLAAWAMVAFGTAYAAWGVRRALRRRAGYALHGHGEGVHLHAHGDHAHEHGHRHAPAMPGATTFWALFIVFVLGPCEPLIPLFVLPASRGRWLLASATAAVFALLTIACMAGLVLAGREGLRLVRLGTLERWAHPLAGGVIAASGLAVIFLGI